MERIRESLDRQGFMRTLGAILESVEPGYGDHHLRLHARPDAAARFVSRRSVASVVDVASGHAALSEAVLFSFWDRPVQEALQLFREERRDA
jgi:hypothetical protein